MQITVILNNIRSNENVGSIFRTCDAAGVGKIMLCGYTPAPEDRFGRENKGLVKASLGAEKFVAWEKFKSLSVAIKSLRNPKKHSVCPKKVFSDFLVVAVEQDKNSVDFRKIKKILKSESKSPNLALVFGSEVDGLSKKDLKLCDLIAEIPMRGAMVRQSHHPRNLKQGKESLNVSVAAGVVLFGIME